MTAAMWGRHKGDRINEAEMRERFRTATRNQTITVLPPDPDFESLHRLRALIADVVAAGYHQQPPHWLTDELWDRLTAETPGVPTVHTEPDEGLFE